MGACFCCNLSLSKISTYAPDFIDVTSTSFLWPSLGMKLFFLTLMMVELA